MAAEENQIIFESILENMDETGALPETYHLPDREVAEEMRFLDGAKDGVRLYHIHSGDIDLTPYKEAIYRILAGQPVEAEQKLKKTFAEKNFTGMVDVNGPLILWMQEHEEAMNSEEFPKFAISELMTTENKELIKFCLTLLSMYDIDPKGQVARIIRVLALSDEFTFFCITLFLNWANANREIFDIARKVHGWGRIHAVHYLEPDTTRIKEWMLTQGWKNRVNNSYNARDIAVKLPLTTVMYRTDLNEAEFAGICGIMDGLMEETRVPGISSLDEKDLLMDGFLKQANGRVLTMQGVDAVQKVRRYKESH